MRNIRRVPPLAALHVRRIFDVSSNRFDYEIVEFDPACEPFIPFPKESITGKRILHLTSEYSENALFSFSFWEEVGRCGEQGAFDYFFDPPGDWFRVIVSSTVSGDVTVFLTYLDDLKKQQHESQQHKERYQLLFEETLNPIFVVDEGGRYIDANPAALEFLECSREELMKKRVGDMDPPEMQVKQRAEHNPFLERRILETAYYINGKRKTLLLNVVPKTISGKTVLYGIGVDITERKMAEEREQLLKRILLAIRNVNQLIVQETNLRDLIRKGCVNLTNTMGFSRSWIILLNTDGSVKDAAASGFGKEFEIIKKQMKKGVLPACMRAVLNHRKIVSITDAEAECEGCALVDGYGSQTAVTGPLAFGDHIYGVMLVSLPARYAQDREILILFTEITSDLGFALHQIEQRERHRLTQERYRQLVDNAGEGIAVTQENRIVFANRKLMELFGFAEEDIITAPFLSFIHPDDQAFVIETAQRTLQGEKPPEYVEVRVYSADGQMRWVDIKGVRISWDDAPAILCFIGDITQRKHAEDALRERVKEKECLYSVNLLFQDADASLEQVCRNILDILPAAMQEPSSISVEITLDNMAYGQQAAEAPFTTQAVIRSNGTERGIITVTSKGEMPFLVEETALLHSVADALGQWLEKREAYEELRKTRQILEKTQALAKLGGWEYDVATGSVFWTEEVYHIYGVGPSTDPTKMSRRSDFYAPDDRPVIEKAFRDAVQSGISFDLEMEFLNKKAERRWVKVMGQPVFENNTVVRVTGSIQDITERRRAEERIRHLSFHDYLTGLYNRAFIEEELKRLGNSRLLPLGVVLCDINGLNNVNDAFGHHVGDQLLIASGTLLRENLRREDLIARWGGSEFIILLPKISEQEISDIASRILMASRGTRVKEIPLNISLGWAIKSIPDLPIDKVITLAEERLHRHKLTENRSARSAIITSLERSLWETTQETEEHATRMRKIARKLATSLNLKEDDLNDLDLLTRLHDLGKISIPRHILNKSSSLTSAEWEMIKKHPEVGYRIAESSPDLLPIAEDILAHHERWDGTGYPRGLKGEEIPLLSRIIAVVDAYDVMLNGRPYKEPMSTAQAIEELERCAGSQFDPKVVEVFLEVIGKYM